MANIRQYVYFAVTSPTVTAHEVAEAIGLGADRTLEHGSRAADRPPVHAWELVCDDPGLRIDEQTQRVVDRLRPHEPQLRQLLAGSDCSSQLQLVRYLDASDGEPELATIAHGLVKLQGQHQLLGWGLSQDVVAFLARVGASIDADEYG